MTNSNNIPTFNDICGTVTQALAETIINREALIAELREKIAQTQDMLRERCTNYTELQKQNIELRKEIEGWREEDRSNERYIKELQDKVLPVQQEVVRVTAQRDAALAEVANLKTRLGELQAENRTRREDFGRGDAYWTAIRERDDARMLYCEFVAKERVKHLPLGIEQTPQDVAKSMSWDGLIFIGWTPRCECCYRPSNDLEVVGDCGGGVVKWCDICRREEKKTNNEVQSDTDPETGVQYGDLN